MDEINRHFLKCAGIVTAALAIHVVNFSIFAKVIPWASTAPPKAVVIFVVIPYGLATLFSPFFTVSWMIGRDGRGGESYRDEMGGMLAISVLLGLAFMAIYEAMPWAT